MKQNILIAALLAGMLALAGCGGGSSSGGGNGEDDTTTTNNNDDTTTTTTSGPATLSGTGLTAGDPIRLEKDETHTTPNGGTITCPTAECIITVADQRGTPKVTATGEATFKPKATVRVNTNDRTAGAGDSGISWLTDRHLINAVYLDGAAVGGIKIDGPRGSEHELTSGPGDDSILGNADDASVGAGGMFNQDPEVTPTSGSLIGKTVIEAAGQRGDDTTLRLIHTRGRTYIASSNSDDDEVLDRDTTFSDYLVFGTWLTVTAADDGPQNTPKIGALVAGTLPYDTDDLPTIGDARYEGKALGYHRPGSGTWIEWDGLVELKANFSRNTSSVSGSITGVQIGTDPNDNTAIFLDPISLDKVTIGQSGKVSGVGSGTWEVGFYGTPINGAPNGIAGSFATSRAAQPERTRTTQISPGVTESTDLPAVTAIEIRGAFGAHHVGQLADDDQQSSDPN